MRKDYGNKRDYRKIDCYRWGVYQFSTTWARDCKEARQACEKEYPGAGWVCEYA